MGDMFQNKGLRLFSFQNPFTWAWNSFKWPYPVVLNYGKASQDVIHIYQTLNGITT